MTTDKYSQTWIKENYPVQTYWYVKHSNYLHKCKIMGHMKLVGRYVVYIRRLSDMKFYWLECEQLYTLEDTTWAIENRAIEWGIRGFHDDNDD